MSCSSFTRLDGADVAVPLLLADDEAERGAVEVAAARRPRGRCRRAASRAGRARSAGRAPRRAAAACRTSCGRAPRSGRGSAAPERRRRGRRRKRLARSARGSRRGPRRGRRRRRRIRGRCGRGCRAPATSTSIVRCSGALISLAHAIISVRCRAGLRCSAGWLSRARGSRGGGPRRGASSR